MAAKIEFLSLTVHEPSFAVQEELILAVCQAIDILLFDASSV